MGEMFSYMQPHSIAKSLGLDQNVLQSNKSDKSMHLTWVKYEKNFVKATTDISSWEENYKKEKMKQSF